MISGVTGSPSGNLGLRALPNIRSGGVLGPSGAAWGRLGALWSRRGGLLGPSESPETAPRAPQEGPTTCHEQGPFS
eukprot:5341680-Pyramimonas_sp.AAC.1